jgi:hypothetical protein
MCVDEVPNVGSAEKHASADFDRLRKRSVTSAVFHATQEGCAGNGKNRRDDLRDADKLMVEQLSVRSGRR